MLNLCCDVLAGHVAYLSMLMVEVYQTHPVLRTFVLLLNQTRASKKKRDDTGLILFL